MARHKDEGLWDLVSTPVVAVIIRPTKLPGSRRFERDAGFGSECLWCLEMRCELDVLCTLPPAGAEQLAGGAELGNVYRVGFKKFAKSPEGFSKGCLR